MKVEKINETSEEVRLRVSATAEEMNRAFTDGLDAFVAQYRMEEQPGTTAQEKIEAALGDDAPAATYSAVINSLVPFALEEFGVLPLATYGIESQGDPAPGVEFSFDMTVLPKPVFELSSYDPATVSVGPAPQVSDEDIEAQVAMLVREFESAKQGKAADDPTLEVPKATDEWVAANLAPMKISSLPELRRKFRDTSIEELASRYEQQKMNAAMAEYAKRFEGEITKTMTAAMVQELYEELLAELAQEGMGLEMFMAKQDLTEEQIRDSLQQQAHNQLIQGFVLDAIFRHEDLKLELADLMTAMRHIAPGREHETVDVMQKTGRNFLVKEAASRMKAAQWVMENTVFSVKE